jgi:succinate dehydrogenase/fumarate reductase cytochrome b subunit
MLLNLIKKLKKKQKIKAKRFKISPHLNIYKSELNSFSSIFDRATMIIFSILFLVILLQLKLLKYFLSYY